MKNMDSPDIKALSEDDQKYLEKGGVIIRPKGTQEIECITRSVPFWHRHVGTDVFEDMHFRDLFFKRMLQFADYKAFKNT